MSAVERIMTHTCDIQDNTPTQNALGEMIDSWAATAVNTGVACKFIHNTGSNSWRRPSPSQSDQFLSEFTVLFPSGQSVDEAQRIANITFEDGSTDAGPFVIERVSTRRDTRRGRMVSAALERINRG